MHRFPLSFYPNFSLFSHSIVYSDYTGKEPSIFPSPILIKRVNSTCGVCGPRSVVMGEPKMMYHTAHQIMNRKKLTQVSADLQPAYFNPTGSYLAMAQWIPENFVDEVESAYHDANS